MTRSGLFVVALFCFVAPPIVFAAENTPSEASIKQLLEVGQAHKLLDAMVAQMDAYMKQAMQQATQGQRITPEIQKDIERRQGEMMAAMKELIDWNKLEPMYVRIYQKSLTQGEIDGLIAFYKTSTGQTLLTKMPVVMQNTMNETAANDAADDATDRADAAGGCSGNPSGKEEERRLMGRARTNSSGPAITRFD